MQARAVIGQAQLAEIARLAAGAYPDEGCGVLVGEVADGVIRIETVLPGHNLRTDRARDRYELDPADILAAERMARAGGRDVVGFWHSHPDHPARPSAFDTERAWTDYIYVIASTTAAGTQDVRGWQLPAEGDQFIEVALDAVSAVSAEPT